MTVMISDLFVSDDRRTEELKKFFLLTPCRSLDEVKVIISGHSHAHAIARALVTKPEINDMVDPRRLGQTHGLAGLLGGHFTPECRRLVVELAQTRDIALSWRGNQHNGDFLLMPDRPLDFVPRSYPDKTVLSGAQVVPEAAIREHFQPSMDELAGILKELGQAPGRRHLVLGTPAPMHNEAEIRRRLGREPAFASRASSLGLDVATIGITPASVRRKLWYVIQEMMAETAASHGAAFVPSPPGSLDAESFLRLDMSGGDITHANERYGRLMLGQIAKLLDKA